MRGQMSGVFRLAYSCAFRQFTESQEKLSLSPSAVGEFGMWKILIIDATNHFRSSSRSGIRVGNALR